MVIPLTPVRFLEYAEKIFARKEGVVCEEKRFTYGEFCRRVRRMSNALIRMGVGKGERVAYLGYNCHRLLELFYAPVLHGAILEPLNIRLAAQGFRIHHPRVCAPPPLSGSGFHRDHRLDPIQNPRDQGLYHPGRDRRIARLDFGEL